MAWGDWFRLIAKGDATKLARVQIDFPNALDENWTIDIKKSKATPPTEVKKKLSQIISKIAGQSIRTHKGRGQKHLDSASYPIWERYADRGKNRYDLNMDHPILESLEKKLTKEQTNALRYYLQSVISSLPVDAIYSDYATNPKSLEQNTLDDTDKEDIIKRLQDLRDAIFSDGKVEIKLLQDVITSTHMFNHCKQIVDDFLAGKYN